MQKPVDTGRQENPASPKRLERELLIGTHLRGRHYGQRSFVPHQQVEHMAAPTSFVRLQFALAKGEPSTHGRDRAGWQNELALTALERASRTGRTTSRIIRWSWIPPPTMLRIPLLEEAP
jgi:hypothetical protein